jgi:hypothetical protein
MFLDLADALADGDSASHSRLDDLRCRKMVGVRVCFKDPVQLQTVLLDKGDEFLGRAGIGPAGHNRETEHRVNNRCGRSFGITNDVAQCASLLVIEVLYVRLHDQIRHPIFLLMSPVPRREEQWHCDQMSDEIAPIIVNAPIADPIDLHD